MKNEYKSSVTDRNLIESDGFTNRLSKDLEKSLLKLAKRFMSEYYNEDVKIIGNDLHFYKKGDEKPDVFSWYQVTIQILPNFITRRLKYHDFEIDGLDSGRFMTFGMQLSLKLVSGRIDYIHKRWETHNPIKVLEDYVKLLDKHKFL